MQGRSKAVRDRFVFVTQLFLNYTSTIFYHHQPLYVAQLGTDIFLEKSLYQNPPRPCPMTSHVKFLHHAG